MAIIYKDIGGACEVAVYRNDQLIGQYIKGQFGAFEPRVSKVIFGMRNTIVGRPFSTTSDGWVKANIEEVQIYSRVLSFDEIRSLSISK